MFLGNIFMDDSFSFKYHIVIIYYVQNIFSRFYEVQSDD